MGTTKTQVVKYIRKGDKGDPGANALDIAVNPSVILHKKTAASGAVYIIAVSVTDGNEKIPYKDGSTDGFLCTKFLETLPDGVKWNWTASGYYFYHFLVFDADTSANIQLSFTITYKGINHTRTVVIKTVEDGSKGIRESKAQCFAGRKRGQIVLWAMFSKQAEKTRAGKMLYFITITITAALRATQKQRQTIREVRLM